MSIVAFHHILISAAIVSSANALFSYRKPFHQNDNSATARRKQHRTVRVDDEDSRADCCPTRHYVADCDGTNVTFTEDMVILNHAVLWCPNAKVGTTSIYGEIQQLVGLTDEIRCSITQRCNLPDVQSVAYAPVEELCNALRYTFIRNPWDRIISTYKDKIETGHIDPWLGSPLHPEREIHFHPEGTPTFGEFVRFVSQQKVRDMNGHWKPSSTRCLTADANFGYDKINKLEEHFEKHVGEMLQKAGFDTAKIADGIEAVPAHTLTKHTLQSRKSFYEAAADSTSSTEDLINLVGEIYADDVAVGKYSFEKYNT